MTKTARARYTLEFKQEAVRLVEGGQSIAAVARTLGVFDQTLFNRSRHSAKAGSKGLTTRQMSVPSRWRLAGCGPNWRA